RSGRSGRSERSKRSSERSNERSSGRSGRSKRSSERGKSNEFGKLLQRSAEKQFNKGVGSLERKAFRVLSGESNIEDEYGKLKGTFKSQGQNLTNKINIV